MLLPALLAGCTPGRPGETACLEGDTFVASGSIPVATGARGDARALGALRHAADAGCERVTIELARQDGSPASAAARVRADVLRDLGVVRLSLPDIDQVEARATDADFGAPLARSAYVVRSPEGAWVYVDIHLGAAAEARVAALESPARIVIDLRPGGAPVPTPAATSVRSVVLAPRPGEHRYPITVTGYARTFEATVVARLEQDGRPAAETFTTATGYIDAWGHYELTFDEGPTGALTLHVGEHSARDGTWEGVAVAVTMQ